MTVPPAPLFRVRLCARLPVYGGRTGLAVRTTQQGKLVVHLDGAGATWEGNRPTVWLDRDEYDVIEDCEGGTSVGEAKMIIKASDLREVDRYSFEFDVTEYVDNEATITYMASCGDTGVSVGIGETPYQAIRELCDALDNLPDDDSEPEAT